MSRYRTGTDVRVTGASHDEGTVGKIDFYGSGPSEGFAILALGDGTYIAVEEDYIVSLRDE